jgi:hypothetical protein
MRLPALEENRFQGRKTVAATLREKRKAIQSSE